MGSCWFAKNLAEPTHGFGAKLSNPKALLHILKALQFRDEVLVEATQKGLKVTAEISKSFQASAFVPKETFTDYVVNNSGNGNKDNNARSNIITADEDNNRPDDDDDDDDEEVSFYVSLSALVQCVNMCGWSQGSGSSASASLTSGASTTTASSASSSCSMLLYHREPGEPLQLWLEEDGVVTEASIPTLEWGSGKSNRYGVRWSAGPAVVGAADREGSAVGTTTPIVARVIMGTEHLKDVLGELLVDSKNDAGTVRLELCPGSSSALTLSTTFSSTSGVGFSAEIPFDSDIVCHAQVAEYQTANYQFGLLRHALKPISASEKVSVRVDAKQFLSVQYMIKFNDSVCFLEFYCAPDIDDL